MNTSVWSSILAGLFVALISIAFSLGSDLLFKSGEVQIFKTYKGDAVYAVITIDSWRLGDNKKFKLLLSGTEKAIQEQSSALFDVATINDRTGNTVVEVTSNISDSRRIAIFEVDKSFDEDKSKLIEGPYGYGLITWNKISYKYITISAIITAIIYGVMFSFGRFVIFRRFDEVHNNLTEKINKSYAEISELKQELNATTAKHQRKIHHIRLFVLKRLVESEKEILFWRNLFEGFFREKFNDTNKISIVMKRIVAIAGGGWKLDMNMDDITYGEILDILDGIGRRAQ